MCCFGLGVAVTQEGEARISLSDINDSDGAGSDDIGQYICNITSNFGLTSSVEANVSVILGQKW